MWKVKGKQERVILTRGCEFSERKDGHQGLWHRTYVFYLIAFIAQQIYMSTYYCAKQ